MNTPISPESAERLASLNVQLAAGGKSGKRYWRSFEELADTDTFKQWVADEFPNRTLAMNVDRRKFLTLSGAAFAMAGLTGCRILPQSKAVPYVRAPEEMVVGIPLTYTSTLTRGGYGLGVLVESHEGRPTKIEGNPNHPASLGATDVWGQADILNLYDPDRSQDVHTNGETSSWDEFWGAARTALAASGPGGSGLALLTETVTSPTLISLMGKLQAKYPASKWYQYDPLNRDNVYAGTIAAFGKPLSPVYKLEVAKIIVSLDSDFLLTDGNNSNVAYAKGFARGRKVRVANPTMNRLYTFESSYTITGASADHRFPVKPSQVEGIARALYSAVSGAAPPEAPAGIDAKAMSAIVADLIANKGASVIIPGDNCSPAVHALAQAMNVALGGVGTTVIYAAPPETNPGNQTAGLKALVDSMNAGQVHSLFIMGGNPVYTAPADFKFKEALMGRNGDRENIPFRVRFGLYEDETSQFCHYQLPEAHSLEAWGDICAFDGTVSLVQPLIQPLYEGRSAIEVLSHLIDDPMGGYDLIADYWQKTGGAPGGAAFTQWWERVLVKGVIPNTASPAVAASLAAGFSAESVPASTAAAGGKLEVSIRPDPSLYDGRCANNSWLQESPKPITSVTWDNVAQISPRTAKDIGLISSTDDNDAQGIADVTGKSVVTVTVGGSKVDLPVWIMPGQPDGVVTVTLGYGRTAAGNIGTGQGFNTYLLRTSDALYNASGDLTKAGANYEVSTTQAHHTMRGINEEKNRDVVYSASLTEYVAKKGRIVEIEEPERVPDAPGFPKSSRVNLGETAQQTMDDGSLGQDTRLGSDNDADVKEVPADYYRKEWKYKNVPSANDAGWPSLYPEFSNKGFNAWGMGIDLTTCIGCNACVIACQAENNIPTVGKAEVGKGREMHWIRIDHYFQSDDLDKVESHFQPLACVHCEKAPCEPVCPVAATVHSHEGLNQMVYNRCIGTRYCSNNCPYKVRRFNFLKWTAGLAGPTTINYDLPVLKMLANPEVTVRGRGVMEKCTYCVQRINRVRIESKKAEREIADGEIVTACQQVCPTEAIVFGDLNNPNSAVSQWRREPHDYLLLSDLNTRPRTSYLSRIKNTNPEIAAVGAAA